MASQSRLGWKFWLWWVIATNAGWFPGIALGTLMGRVLADKVTAEVGPVFGGAIVETSPPGWPARFSG